MPLFGPRQSPPFEPFKSKTYLKCAVARIKQNTQKKQNENKVLAKELGKLLADGKEEMARIRVEHMIRSTNEVHAMEIIELFCDLLLARHVRRPILPPHPPAPSSHPPAPTLRARADTAALRGGAQLLIESEAQNEMAASGSRFTVMPPVELQEAIFSLCWATGRAGVEELKGVKEQFRLLYPKAFGLDEYGRPLEQVRPRSRRP